MSLLYSNKMMGISRPSYAGLIHVTSRPKLCIKASRVAVCNKLPFNPSKKYGISSPSSVTVTEGAHFKCWSNQQGSGFKGSNLAPMGIALFKNFIWELRLGVLFLIGLPAQLNNMVLSNLGRLLKVATITLAFVATLIVAASTTDSALSHLLSYLFESLVGEAITVLRKLIASPREKKRS